MQNSLINKVDLSDEDWVVYASSFEYKLLYILKKTNCRRYTSLMTKAFCILSLGNKSRK